MPSSKRLASGWLRIQKVRRPGSVAQENELNSILIPVKQRHCSESFKQSMDAAKGFSEHDWTICCSPKSIKGSLCPSWNFSLSKDYKGNRRRERVRSSRTRMFTTFGPHGMSPSHFFFLLFWPAFDVRQRNRCQRLKQKPKGLRGGCSCIQVRMYPKSPWPWYDAETNRQFPSCFDFPVESKTIHIWCLNWQTRYFSVSKLSDLRNKWIVKTNVNYWHDYSDIITFKMTLIHAPRTMAPLVNAPS